MVKKYEKRLERLRSDLKGIIGASDLTGDMIARRSGVDRSTISRHLNNIGELRVKELFAILDAGGASLKIERGEP